MARRFMGNLFETKAKANPQEAPIRAGGRALGSAGMPLGDAGQWDMERAVRDGYERVGMVFRCVDAIAQTQSRIQMSRIRVDARIARADSQVIDDPYTWRLLNFKANSYETSTQFRYRLSSTLLLSRRGAFVEMVPGKDGRPESLHLLAPGQVKPVPDPKTFVSSYQIMRGDSVIDEVDPATVMWIKIKPHPMDPYQQMTPLVAAGLSAETDFLARMFNRNFLMNDGRPGMLISVRGQLNREDADELKSRYSGGIQQAGQTSVIEADGIDIADMAVNSRDMQWAEMVAGNKQDIQLAFGVPESVMGNASGRTFDNADAERENYYIDTIMPHCDAIAQGLDKITGDDNDDEVIAFDYSQVDVLQRMAARKREEKRTEFDKGLISVDEYREAAGQAPFGVAGTRVLYNPKGFAIPQNPMDQAEIDKLKMVGGGAAPGEAPTAEDTSVAARAGALLGAQEASRQLGNTNAAIAVRARALQMKKDAPGEQKALEKARDRKVRPKDKPSTARRQRRTQEAARPRVREQIEAKDDIDLLHPYAGLRYKTEGMIEGLLTQWDSRQEDVVAERLHHVKFRKGTRHWMEEKKLPKRQKCKYCTEQATKRIIHAEGMAYVPVCDEHLGKGKDDASRATPDGTPHPENIDRIDEIKSDGEQQVLRYQIPETKAKRLDSSYAADDGEWTREIVGSMGAYVRKAMLREAKNAAKNMKNDKIDKYTDLDLSGRNPLNSLFGSEEGVEKVLGPLFEAVMEIVRNAAKNQTRRMQQTIEKMDEEGATIPQMEAAIRKQAGARTPWRKNLAIAVTTAAVEGARTAVYETAPEMYVKQWNSMHDARVRPTHVKADNQQREPHKHFNVGGAKLLFPCDPSGPPEETINCRCYTTQELSDKYWDMVDAAFDAGDDDA